MPQKPPAPNPAPPKDCDSDGVVNAKETRLAMQRWRGNAHYACGHRRVPVSTWHGRLSDRQLADEVRLGGTATERGMATDEAADRRRQCRACENQSRRNRRHWSAIALAAALLLLALWRCW
jgi:hypothetical protein